MQQRLPTANGHDRRAEFGEAIDTPVHGLNRHRLGDIVVLVAVGAGEIAAPHRDDVRHYGMIDVCQSLADHPKLAYPTLGGRKVSLHARGRLWGS